MVAARYRLRRDWIIPIFRCYTIMPTWLASDQFDRCQQSMLLHRLVILRFILCSSRGRPSPGQPAEPLFVRIYPMPSRPRVHRAAHWSTSVNNLPKVKATSYSPSLPDTCISCPAAGATGMHNLGLLRLVIMLLQS